MSLTTQEIAKNLQEQTIIAAVLIPLFLRKTAQAAERTL
jgi:hypothetical protein